MEHPIGIDFGGTGIKGAPVDLDRGDFAQDRVRIDTPKPADPGQPPAYLLRCRSRFRHRASLTAAAHPRCGSR